MLPDPDNSIFQLAARFVNQTGRHIFLTGKAGTGKTTFLKYIRDNCFKKLVVLAPTGVAAINAGGVTLHSFFQLPFGPFAPSSQRILDPDSRTSDPHTLFKNIRFSTDKRALLMSLELMVIDEVSMVRADVLDAVDTILRHFRQQPLLPFGGVQVIYIGDLFQLPPVVPGEDWELLKAYYKSPFFFDAWAIQQSAPVSLELKKIYRQNETGFIQLLHNIRNNQMTVKDMRKLEEFYQPGFQPRSGENYITLTSHNAQADRINKEQLGKLAGSLYSFEATLTGEFPEKSYPSEKILHLKEGAQVMFIKNDKGDARRFFNGKIATVKKIAGEKIIVGFPGKTGELTLEKEVWKNVRYQYNREKDRIEEEELGSFSQYPVRLAWAITIHKSQGLTFEKAIIDAGASFAPGQVYVALSRLTSTQGLVLLTRIHASAIGTDKRVVDFTENGSMEEDALLMQFEKEQKLFISSALLEFFNWSKLIENAKENCGAFDHKQLPEKTAHLRLAKEWIGKLLEQEKTARNFSRQLEQLLLTAEADGYRELNQRIQAGSHYFTQLLDNELIHSIRKQSADMKKKKKVKAYLQALEALIQSCIRKKQEMEQAAQVVSALVENQDPAAHRARLAGS